MISQGSVYYVRGIIKEKSYWRNASPAEEKTLNILLLKIVWVGFVSESIHLWGPLSDDGKLWLLSGQVGELKIGP